MILLAGFIWTDITLRFTGLDAGNFRADVFLDWIWDADADQVATVKQYEKVVAMDMYL
jgi:hypothetical protein